MTDDAVAPTPDRPTEEAPLAPGFFRTVMGTTALYFLLILSATALVPLLATVSLFWPVPADAMASLIGPGDGAISLVLAALLCVHAGVYAASGAERPRYGCAFITGACVGLVWFLLVSGVMIALRSHDGGLPDIVVVVGVCVFLALIGAPFAGLVQRRAPFLFSPSFLRPVIGHALFALGLYALTLAGLALALYEGDLVIAPADRVVAIAVPIAGVLLTVAGGLVLALRQYKEHRFRTVALTLGTFLVVALFAALFTMRERGCHLSREACAEVVEAYNARLPVGRTLNDVDDYMQAWRVFADAAKAERLSLASLLFGCPSTVSEWRKKPHAAWSRALANSAKAVQQLRELGRREFGFLPLASSTGGAAGEGDAPDALKAWGHGIDDVRVWDLLHALERAAAHAAARRDYTGAIAACDARYRLYRLKHAEALFHPDAGLYTRSSSMRLTAAVAADRNITPESLKELHDAVRAWKLMPSLSREAMKLGADVRTEYVVWRTLPDTRKLTPAIFVKLVYAQPETLRRVYHASRKEILRTGDGSGMCKRSVDFWHDYVDGWRDPVAVVGGFRSLVACHFAETGQFESALRMDALLALLEGYIAARRYQMKHGRLPKSWDDLVPAYLDAVPCSPLWGEPLGFKRHGRRLALYCLGTDDRDEHEKMAFWHIPIRGTSADDTCLWLEEK